MLPSVGALTSITSWFGVPGIDQAGSHCPGRWFGLKLLRAVPMLRN